jgi:hypothetical protein
VLKMAGVPPRYLGSLDCVPVATPEAMRYRGVCRMWLEWVL